MGYLFLLASLAAGATKGYCGKKTSGYMSETKDALLANSFRMALCVLISFFVLILQGQIQSLQISCQVLWLSLFSAVANSAFVVLWLLSVKNGAYMMLDVFCMLGVLIPLVGGTLFFHEEIRMNHIVGVLLLVISALIMCSYNNSIKKKLTVSSVLLLLACGAASGLSDFTQKLFVQLTNAVPIAVFNLYTYLFSTVILTVGFMALSHSSPRNTPTADIKPIFCYLLIMAVCLFINAYCKTKAATFLSSVQLYPLSQGGSLILSTLMSSILFHEKMTAKGFFGILLSFIALLMINML